MRIRLALLLLVFVVLPASAGAVAPPFKTAFKAPTHRPRVNVKWPWQLKVTNRKGKPINARITVEIIDPFGGVHPVEFDCCKKNIVRHRIKGVFRDKVTFPPEARSFKLTFRITVEALGRKRAVRYWIKAR